MCMQMLMDLGPDVYRRVFEDAYLSKATEFFKVGGTVGLHATCSIDQAV